MRFAEEGVALTSRGGHCSKAAPKRSAMVHARSSRSFLLMMRCSSRTRVFDTPRYALYSASPSSTAPSFCRRRAWRVSRRGVLLRVNGGFPPRLFCASRPAAPDQMRSSIPQIFPAIVHSFLPPNSWPPSACLFHPGLNLIAESFSFHEELISP